MSLPKIPEIFEIVETEEQAREAMAGRSILVYMAQWCGPCRVQIEEIERIYPRIAERLQRSGARLCYIDIDKLKRFADKQSVFSLPTFTAYKEGRITRELIGIRFGRELEELIELYNPQARMPAEQIEY